MIGSFCNQVFPVRDLYTIWDPKGANSSTQPVVPDSTLAAISAAAQRGLSAEVDPNPADLDNNNSSAGLPPQPSYPSSTTPTILLGDRIHRRHPNWVYGDHVVDPCLWDKSGVEIASVHRYKSDLLPKGFNTPAEIAKTAIAPSQTATTDTKHFEHQWIVAKAVDPHSNQEFWIASWKDFEGNIQVWQYSSLEAANRAASSTKGNDAGRGIKKLEDLDGNNFTVGNLIEYMRSIQAGYHLTLCNCIGYATNIMNAFKNRVLPSAPSQVFNHSQLQNLANRNSNSDAAPPSATYTTKEERGRFGKPKVILFKNGERIASAKRSHFKDARRDIDLLAKDDYNRDMQLHRSMQRLKAKQTKPVAFDPQASPPKPPPELKNPQYKYNEYGSRGSRKVNVVDTETGDVVARFNAKHFRDARGQANTWLRQDAQNRQVEHDQAVKNYEEALQQYNQAQQQHQRTQKINQLKTSIASAVTSSVIENAHYLQEGELTTFGKNVTVDSAQGTAVTVAVGSISNYVPYYSSGCAVVRAVKDGRVKAVQGETPYQYVGNPALKIALNIGVPMLFAGAIASNPITGGVALACWAKGVDVGVNSLI